jgi:hypothetical protein
MKILWTAFAANSEKYLLKDIKLLFRTMGVVILCDTPAMLRGPSEGLIGRAVQGHEHGIENF